MKRLIIIVEGQTEQEFVNKVLKPFLKIHGVYEVNATVIKASKGGIANYQQLKTDILNCVYQSNVLVSCMVDYYALPTDFPQYQEITALAISANNKIELLEQAIKQEIEQDKGRQFVNLLPYIQVHEFEALVFAAAATGAVDRLYDAKEADLSKINAICKQYSNPESINNSPQTAPSKRLKKLIVGYNKIIDGIYIIQHASIDDIMQKCPRFNNWVNQLIVQSK